MKRDTYHNSYLVANSIKSILKNMLQDLFKDSAIKLTGAPSDHGKLIKNNITAGGLTLGCPTAQSPTYNCFLNNFKM